MKTHLMGRVMACKVLLLMLVVVPAALIPPGGVPRVAAAPPPVEEWVARYQGPGGGEDNGRQLAVDAAGNVYVTGWSYDSVTGLDYATIKYDSAFIQEWVARYKGNGGGGGDRAHDVAVDGSGNVYVTGTSWDPLARGSGYDSVTIKYLPDGRVAPGWPQAYDRAGGAEETFGVAVDASGNVYVTGVSYGGDPATGGTANDGLTIKYNSSGVQQWVETYDLAHGDDSLHGVAVDGAGNAYVTGPFTTAGGDTDYVTIKYNSSGGPAWLKTYDGPGPGGDENPWPIAVDEFGNVYVTGYSSNGSDYDYATIKYHGTSGNQLWEKRYDGPAGLGDTAWGLALDGAGNVYVTGGSAGTGGDADITTIKYDSSGNIVTGWPARYDYVGQPDTGDRVAVDGAGNVYVTGSSVGSGTSYDYATVKYNSAGIEQWVARYDYASGNDAAKDVALDGAGNVYVTGYSWNGSDYDYATIRYAPPQPHYDCRLAPGMLDPPVVRVDTQFAVDQGVDAGPGFSLCAPALKNGVGVPDTETAHLRCFIAPGPAPNRVVNLRTQFGELRNVLVGERALLCAPASKTEFPGPPPLPPEPPEPHYLCYYITGPAVNEGVTVQSQFTMMEPVHTMVGSPELLCLPAGKNGAPIPDAPHEVCYQAGLPFFAPMMYNVLTQFGLEPPLQLLFGPSWLCVPAAKEVVEPPETPSFSLMGWSGAPPDAILQLNPVVGGPPVVAIPGAALGLGIWGPDYLASLSYGMEYPNNTTPFLRFSMGLDYPMVPTFDGLPGTDVNKESMCMGALPGQDIGDEFDAPMPPPPPGAGNTNILVLDENGVQDAPACAFPPGYPVGTGGPPGDDLVALEERPPSFVDSNGDGTLERPVFFTLAPGSTTLAAMGVTAAEILMKAPGAGGVLPMIYAAGPALGLNTMPPYGDAIDALMLYDNGDLTFGCGDWAWLSLMLGSPTLGLLGATEGDVLFVDGCNPGVIQVQYTANQLGLCDFGNPVCIIGPMPMLSDDVDALKGELPCLTGPDSDLAIGNGKSIPGDDGTVPNGDNPAADDCQDTDDDNDGYPDQSEFVQFDPIACPAKTALTSPGGDITYDDNNNGNPAAGSLGGTDLADDPPSWDSDGDSVLDGAECTLGTDPANPASIPTTAQCGGTGDTDGDGLLNAWETCKWHTNPAVVDSDGDTLGDCIEVVDTDGNGVVDFGADALNSARASLLSSAAFGKDGDFDLDGNNVIDFGADTLTVARMALGIWTCQ